MHAFLLRGSRAITAFPSCAGGRACGALALGTLLYAPAPTLAQRAESPGDFPTKPLRLLVPFPPGGISDVLARALGARLTVSLGRPVLIDNRPGAGTTIASGMTAAAAPDGYTLMMQDITTHAINATLYPKLGYDSVKSFTTVALVASSPLMLVVPPTFQAKSVRELIALGRTRPNDFSYASPGNGTLPHLVTEVFKKQTGTGFLHVPFKGNAALRVLAGEVELTFSVMPPAVSNVKAGKLVALGVTSAKRVAAAPDVPTMIEAGLADFEFVLYSGVLGPAGISAPIVAKLNREIAVAVASVEMQTTLATIGADAVSVSPQQFQKYLVQEMSKLARLVNETGAKLD
ncbi:MAG: tripartite tricarboxylate transporter substrate binding protein [Proteobacteria bacterium]|nr:tripartite tricarboxylate transporter substrate binding protein [Burkholderiales bacterium]